MIRETSTVNIFGEPSFFVCRFLSPSTHYFIDSIFYLLDTRIEFRANPQDNERSVKNRAKNNIKNCQILPLTKESGKKHRDKKHKI